MYEDIVSIAGVVWRGLYTMGPYILLGIAASALIKTYKLDRRFWVTLNRGGVWVILFATLAGVFSPLCSCGVLPIVVTLIESGSPLAPAMALLMTSPIADPNSIMVNYAGLGMGLTVAKVGGAVFMGLFTGFITHLLVRAGYIPQDVFTGAPRKTYCDAKVDPDRPHVVPIDTVLAERKLPFFFARAKDTTILVGKYILLALLVQGVIETYVPANWIYSLAGGEGMKGILAALVIGLPLPVNGLTSVPIVKGLIHSGAGMGDAAAVTFLMAGPVTSIPAMLALWGMFKKKVFVLYMAAGITGSLIMGFFWMLAVG